MNEDKFDNVPLDVDSLAVYDSMTANANAIFKEFAKKIGEQKECPPEFEETFQKHLPEILAKF